MTDYPDYQTPQAHADTISNTGVPLLARPGALVNVTSTIASGTSKTIAGPVTVHKIGYEISLYVFAPATAASVVTIQMQWTDSISGQIVTTEEWDFWAGSGTLINAHVIRGTGPTKGDTLTILGTANVSGVTTSYQIVVAENSRVYLRDDWRTVSSGPVTGITGTNGFEPANMILVQMNAIAVAGAGGSVVATMPLYCGKVVVSGETLSGAADMAAVIEAKTGAFGSLVFDQCVRVRSDANGVIAPVTASLPRAQCAIQLVNSNAAAKDLNLFVTAADF